MSDKPLSRFVQPIAVPGRRLLHHIPLRFVRKKVAGGGGRALNAEIPLIPFIDFLLCIVLFLLASFSASGELPIDKNVQLPNAENVADMVEAPMVAITGTQILVDGAPAGNTRAIVDGNRLARVEIEGDQSAGAVLLTDERWQIGRASCRERVFRVV